MRGVLLRSSHQLTYKQAQDILDGAPAAAGDELPPDARKRVRAGLEVLERLAAARRSTRLEVPPTRKRAFSMNGERAWLVV